MILTFAETVELSVRLLSQAGMNLEQARDTAEAIVCADVWGVGSHGLLRLPRYLDRMLAGGCPPEAALSVVVDTGPVLVLDGGGGMGHWQLTAAATQASERCGRFGIAAVAVGNTSHAGALGIYTLMVAEAGHVALAFGNGPAVMAPWGGTRPVLSTSPVSAAFPVGGHAAVIDLALSTAARGKIAAKAAAGESIPPGWAVSADGRAVTDPTEALQAMLAPLGGAKGAALATMVELLSGGLVGPALSSEVVDFFDPKSTHLPQRNSHLLVAFDPVTLGTREDGSSEERIARLQSQVVAAGGRVPGETRRLPRAIDPHYPVEIHDPLLDELRRRLS